MNHIFKLMLVMIGLCLTGPAGNLNAQADSAKSSFLTPHSWALQYGLDLGLSDGVRLDPIDGSQFTLRRQLSKTRAVRLSVTLTGRKSESDEARDIVYTDTVYQQGYITNENSADVLFSAKFYWVGRRSSRLFPYIGLGPTFRFSKYGSERSDLQNAYFDEYVSRQSAIGVAGSFGTEYFIVTGVSLFVEVSYGVEISTTRSTLRRRSGSGNSYQETNQDIERASWLTSSDNGRIGISITL